jgi:hypothetical protein
MAAGLGVNLAAPVRPAADLDCAAASAWATVTPLQTRQFL